MKDDMISRQAAIEKVKELCKGCYLSEHCGKCLAKCLVRKAVKILEKVSPAQQWILCTPETMPKENGQYIVTVKYEHVDGYEDIYSEHGEWVDGHWDAGYGHCGRVEKVLAWQPLPQPYREGGQE